MGRFDALTQLDKKTANPQGDKSATIKNRLPPSPQVDMSASTQNNLAASVQVDKPASGQVDKSANEKAERYTTRLQPSIIKRVKRYAFEHEINDYDVVQNAIREYLEKNI
jgi:hypothetical protein